MIRFLCLILLVQLCAAISGGAVPLLKANDRVLVLGDSITQDGRYVAVLDLLRRCRMPQTPVEFIPLGLASETVSGASEKHHPWPRPDVHERAGRALEKVKPTAVLFCYGMNDGIYAPLDEGRFVKFQEAVKSLVALCRAAGVRQTIIITPPPFDPVSYKGSLAPDGFDDYGYKSPWKNYNQTLARYAAWERDTPGLADRVIDLHTPLTTVFATWHRVNPGWSSGDGVHPVAEGHWLMAGLIAEGLGIPGAVADLNAAAPEATGGWTVSFSAAPPIAAPEGIPAGFLKAGGFQKQMNRFELTIPNTPPAALRLKSGDTLLGVVTRPQLARGLDLSGWPALSLNRDAAAALPLAMERHRILSAAWREHVGHTRPDTDRTAMPLEEAKAAAAKIEEKLTVLLKVREESLRLEPVAP
ncbi:MAG TPA: SGNH/GDSL hydrolase family protein [Verrucomicrobiales bacterium]|nr:SGNH/GDSL hydrolase family protein [Verrucomicrobiales bacterium]